jgi:hypothetical protein
MMAVMIPRETSTDQRLDALSRQLSEGFARMDERFKQIDERFKKVDERFKQVDERLNRLEGRFDAYVRGQWQVGGMIFAALLGVIATQI